MQEIYMEEKLITDKKFQEITMEKCEFIDCDFENCSFEECKIVNCIFRNCSFYNCTIISLSSQHSEVRNLILKKCNLIGVHWNELLPAGKYAYAIDRMENCYIKYNSFVEMNFTKFDFSGNSIQESEFEECNLQESNFKDCGLERTQFYKCDLRKSDFRNAIGYVIDITSNKVTNAKFSYPEVIHLLDTLQINID